MTTNPLVTTPYGAESAVPVTPAVPPSSSALTVPTSSSKGGITGFFPWLLDKMQNEPWLVAGVINAALACALIFGWHVSKEAVATFMSLGGAIVALVGRNNTTPTANPDPGAVQAFVMNNASLLRTLLNGSGSPVPTPVAANVPAATPNISTTAP